MHRCLVFDAGGRATEARAPEDMERSGGVWLDLDDPDAAEVEGWLKRLLRLHPLAAARLGEGDRPRLQVYEHCVEMRFPLVGGAGGLTVLLAPGRAVTVHRGIVAAVDAAWRAFSEGHERAGGVDLAVYHVLNHVVSGYERLVGELVDAVEAMNLALPAFRRLRALRRIVVIRRRAYELHRLVAPAVDLFGLLDARDFPFVQRQHRAYFEDLHARARGVAADVDASRELLAQDVENLTAVQSQRVNNTMKVLTVISVIFLPGTLIASIYGMNFHIPEYAWPQGYAWSLGLMLVVTVVLLLLLHRRGWLK